MANVRINQFENLPLFQVGSWNAAALWGNGVVVLQYTYIPGSLSFNSIQFLFANGNNTVTMTNSFGLYSLTGSTLSLANSASGSFNGAAGTRWVTMATSATQDITPGDWFLAFIVSTAGSSQASFMAPRLDNNIPVIGADYEGPFFKGEHPTTTSAFYGSIATSDLTKEPTAGISQYQYILISA